jgi:hypothetical protein
MRHRKPVSDQKIKEKKESIRESSRRMEQFQKTEEISDDEYRRYDSYLETSGCLFKVKNEFILKFLRAEQKSLIVRCIVDRQLEERDYRERNRDNRNQVKLYLIKPDGKVKTLRGRDYKIG